MSTQDRGLFDPPEDDLDVFDATDEQEAEQKRSPLFVILAVLVLAAFAGVIWVAYSQGVEQGGKTTPPVLTADATPIKTPVAAPAQPAQSDLRVLDPSAPADQTHIVLAAPPEEPQPLPQEAATPPAGSPPTGSGGSASIATSPLSAVTAGAAAAGLATAPASAAETEAPSAAIAEEPAEMDVAAVMHGTEPAPAPTAAAPAEPAPAPAPAASAEPAPLAPSAAPEPAPTQTAAVPTPSVADAGNFVVQVSAHKTDAEAADAWAKLKAAESDLLGELSPSFQRADLGAKGVWFRLRVGPFETKQTAQDLCNSLKARKRDCMVREP